MSRVLIFLNYCTKTKMESKIARLLEIVLKTTYSHPTNATFDEGVYLKVAKTMQIFCRNANTKRISCMKQFKLFSFQRLISGGSRISRRGGVDPLGGHGPPMWVLFGKNVCENERIGSRRGGVRPARPPRSANVNRYSNFPSRFK